MKIKAIRIIEESESTQFYDIVEATPFHNFLVESGNKYIISHNCNFTDEVNFGVSSDVEKLKKKQKTLISQVDARMQSRFMKGTKLPTLQIIASSKRSEQSFLETYIELKKKTENKTTLIIDEPQWVIRNDKDSKEKFYVAVGNKFLASEVLPKNAGEDILDAYRKKGYNLLAVPIGYYQNFIEDVDVALTDIAGISTINSMKYISGLRWSSIKTPDYKNPFIRDVIEVGNAPDDRAQYYHFFDMSAVDKNLLARPLYIHLDMSLSGDKTGIAGIWITGKQATTDMSTSKELFYKLAFSVSIKAPKGYQVSFEKNRNFIRWLREQGFVIKGISSDTFQSAQMQQQLKADGFEVSTISVDRLQTLDKVPGRAEDGSTPSRKVCIPYQYFKSTLYERRLTVYDKCDLLTDEVLGLEKQADGHIDHPEGGTMGCFTGETKVRLTDGRSLSFLELIEEQNKGIQNYVYSINKDKQTIEAKPIVKAWKTLENQPLVRITLDNDQVIECTLNHRFMLRNGEYIEARDLIPGESLMPLYTTTSNYLKGYRLLYNPFKNQWHFEHRQFAEEVYDSKYLVHHKDCNPSNNNPSNLIWCSKAEHQRIHAELSSGAHSPEAERKRSESLKNYYKNNKTNPAFINRNKKISAKLKSYTPEEVRKLKEEQSIKRHKIYLSRLEAHDKIQAQQEKKIKDFKEIFNLDYNNLTASEKNAYAVKLNRLNNPEVQERITKAIKQNHKLGKYENAKKALNNHDIKMKELKSLFPVIDRELFKEFFDFDYDSLPNASLKGVWANRYRQHLYELKNHKVKSIEFIDKKADVYDIEVKDNHNFALDAGVFVHNSKDQCDAMVGALYNASLHAEEFSYDYGENYQALAAVNFGDNNSTLDLNKSMEEELKKLGPVLPTHPSNVFTKTDNYTLYGDFLIL